MPDAPIQPDLAVPPAEREALDALCARDPDLAGIERAAGPLPWRRRPKGFAGLLAAIVGQQISNAAAAAIWSRLAALAPHSLDAETILRLPEEALRAAGLSRPKIGYARAVATAVVSGRFDPDALERMADEEAIATLTALPGFGRWTAEIYLLFALERRDVFPAADLALAASAVALKGLPARPSERALRALAEPWAPARGLAARLLWHHWRSITARPAFDPA